MFTVGEIQSAPFGLVAISWKEYIRDEKRECDMTSACAHEKVCYERLFACTLKTFDFPLGVCLSLSTKPTFQELDGTLLRFKPTCTVSVARVPRAINGFKSIFLSDCS